MHSKKSLDQSLFLSCDWGTTSFRLRLADLETGSVLSEVSDSDGVKKLHADSSGSDSQKKRDASFTSLLRKKISILEEKTSRNLAQVSIVISGMASSSIGWRELPYASLPLWLEKPDLAAEVIKKHRGFPHDVVLVSGVCSSDDVMRGEETQVIGLFSEYRSEDAICILPGTHSKHLHVRQGKLVDFKTYMTGEVFELISSESILRNSMKPQNDVDSGKTTDAQISESSVSESFTRGVQQALDNNFLHSLFSVRARHLLYQTSPEDHYEFTSGLLIGTELKDLIEPTRETSGDEARKKIVLAGGITLQRYYSAALDHLGIPHQTAGDSADLTTAGHLRILQNLEHSL